MTVAVTRGSACVRVWTVPVVKACAPATTTATLVVNHLEPRGCMPCITSRMAMLPTQSPPPTLSVEDDDGLTNGVAPAIQGGPAAGRKLVACAIGTGAVVKGAAIGIAPAAQGGPEAGHKPMASEQV